MWASRFKETKSEFLCGPKNIRIHPSRLFSNFTTSCWPGIWRQNVEVMRYSLKPKKYKKTWTKNQNPKQKTPKTEKPQTNQPMKTELNPPHLLLFSVQPWSACQEVPIYCTVSMISHSCKDHISLYKHPLWWMNFNWTLELDSWSCTDQLLELGVFQEKPCKKPSLYGFHNNLESKSCVGDSGLLETPEHSSNKDIIIHLIMT